MVVDGWSLKRYVRHKKEVFLDDNLNAPQHRKNALFREEIMPGLFVRESEPTKVLLLTRADLTSVISPGDSCSVAEVYKWQVTR